MLLGLLLEDMSGSSSENSNEGSTLGRVDDKFLKR